LRRQGSHNDCVLMTMMMVTTTTTTSFCIRWNAMIQLIQRLQSETQERTPTVVTVN